MHISTRIQRSCAELYAITARDQTDDAFAMALKAWVSGSLAKVSSRLAGRVAGSALLQFILKTPPAELPVAQEALRQLGDWAHAGIDEKDQDRYFDCVTGWMEDIVCPALDDCPLCQSERRLLRDRVSGEPLIECSCCGRLSSFPLDRDATAPGGVDVPTRGELARWLSLRGQGG